MQGYKAFFIGVSYVYSSPPYNKFSKIDLVRYVILGVPDQNEIGTNAPIGESWNDPFVVLVTVATYLVVVDAGEELDADHNFDIMVGCFTLPFMEEE